MMYVWPNRHNGPLVLYPNTPLLSQHSPSFLSPRSQSHNIKQYNFKSPAIFKIFKHFEISISSKYTKPLNCGLLINNNNNNKVCVFLFQREEPWHTLNQIKAIPKSTSINTSVLDVWDSLMVFWSPNGSGLCVHTIAEVGLSGTRTLGGYRIIPELVIDWNSHNLPTLHSNSVQRREASVPLGKEGVSSHSYHCSLFPENGLSSLWMVVVWGKVQEKLVIEKGGDDNVYSWIS